MVRNNSLRQWWGIWKKAVVNCVLVISTYLVSSIQYVSCLCLTIHNEYVIFLIFSFWILLFIWYDGLHRFLIISFHTGPTELKHSSKFSSGHQLSGKKKISEIGWVGAKIQGFEDDKAQIPPFLRDTMYNDLSIKQHLNKQRWYSTII